MDNETQLTTFDQMTQSRQLQMLKTMIPYMKNQRQMRLAVLIKYLELQNTIQVFSKEENVVSMCSLPENEDYRIAMLTDLRKFCTEKEQETLDMVANMWSMLETYETIFTP